MSARKDDLRGPTVTAQWPLPSSAGPQPASEVPLVQLTYQSLLLKSLGHGAARTPESVVHESLIRAHHILVSESSSEISEIILGPHDDTLVFTRHYVGCKSSYVRKKIPHPVKHRYHD